MRSWIVGLWLAAVPGCTDSAAPAREVPAEHDSGAPQDAGSGRRVAPVGVCTSPASASVPCQDAPDPCGIDSGFPGDELCLLPPPPELGVQIHLGPEDYGDPDQLAPYLLQAGDEQTVIGLADIPTDQDRHFDFVQMRMRPGAHHLINRVFTKHEQEGIIAGDLCPGTLQSWYFPGSQTLVRDDPAHGIVAPENEGLGRLLPGDSTLCMNLHAYNASAEPLLREVWINVYFMDEQDVSQTEQRIALNAPVFEIPPGARRALTATAPIEGDGRIINLYGHRHAWTDRFAVWHNDVLIYESWNWLESATFDFNSVTDNPPIDPQGRRDGAVSGPLHVRDGDALRILCEVNNRSDHTVAFGNDAFRGEMCILFGATVGARVVSPGFPL